MEKWIINYKIIIKSILGRFSLLIDRGTIRVKDDYIFFGRQISMAKNDKNKA